MAILSADRIIDWSTAGVPGGVPSRTTIYTTLTPSGGDDSTIIQAALLACTTNQVVKLSEGIFTCNAMINWQGVANGVVLRGSGPDLTKVVFTGGYIRFGTIASEESLLVCVDLASDCVKGSNTITLTSMPSWVHVGDLYIVDQLDDPSIAIHEGVEGGRSYREIMGAGARGMGQIVKVTEINGNTITTEYPINYPYSTAFTAQLAEAGYDAANGVLPLKNCGIEDMQLLATYEYAYANMINMQMCDSCWVKNVTSVYIAGGCHVIMYFCYQCEVRDSFFDDCHLHTAGQAYGVALYHVTTGSLVENNICRRLMAPYTVQYGCNGNVFGYNFETAGESISRQFSGFGSHGTHSYMTLWEGNWVQDKILFDYTHGSSSHHVLLRNRVKGHNAAYSQDQTVASIEEYNRKCSLIGNLLGDPLWHDVYSCCMSGCSTSTCEDVTKPIFKLGYVANWSCNSSEYDDNATMAIIIHGNHDTVTDLVSWDPTIADHDIPNSYYKSGKPSWFDESQAWPPFDSSNPTANNQNQIPAGVRYGLLAGLLPVTSTEVDLSDEAGRLQVTGGMIVNGALTQKLMAGDDFSTSDSALASRLKISAAGGLEGFVSGTRWFQLPANGGAMIAPGFVGPYGLANMYIGGTETGGQCDISLSTGTSGLGESSIDITSTSIVMTTDGSIKVTIDDQGITVSNCLQGIWLPDLATVDGVDVSELNNIVRVGPTCHDARLTSLEYRMSQAESRLDVLEG